MRRGGTLRRLGMVLCLLLLGGCARATPPPQRILRVVTDAASPPFSFLEDGQLVGFDIDLMRAIAAEAGWRVEFAQASFDAVLDGVAVGTYDAAISSITITEARRDRMLFSTPYFSAGQLIVVLRNNVQIVTSTDLSGQQVGALVASTGADKAAGLGAEVRPYPTLDDAFAALAAGELDAVLADNPLALRFIAHYGGRLKAVGAPITYEQYGIAVRRNAPLLLQDINTALAALMERGLLRDLQEKWMEWNAPR